MSMRLTRSRMLSRIEEGEQFSMVVIGFHTSVGRSQIIFLQQVCLLFEFFRCKYEVLRDNSELVQYNDMAWEDIADQEALWWIEEGIDWLFGLVRLVGLGFVCQSRREAYLELRIVTLAPRTCSMRFGPRHTGILLSPQRTIAN